MKKKMEPVTWPAFADLHPFAPAEDSAGYRRLVDRYLLDFNE